MGNFTAAQRELWRGWLFTSADVTERERDVIEPWIGVHSRRQREEKKKEYETYLDICGDQDKISLIRINPAFIRVPLF